jgi:hypothetical protein
MPAQLEPRETATGETAPQRITWRERLGALFAPGARRYAVPALALLLVSAISFIVLTRRTQRESSVETSVAQRNTSNAQRPQAAQPETHHAPQDGNPAVTATATPGDRSANVATDSNASRATEEIAANKQRVETVQPLADVTVSDDAPPPPPAPSTVSGAAARPVSELPTPMPTPHPVAETAAVMSEQEMKSNSGKPAAELAKTERRQGGFEDRQYNNRREQISGPRRNEQARNTRAADDSRNRADNRDGNSAVTAAPAALPPPAAKRTRQQEAEHGKDETRPAEDAGRNNGARLGSAAGTRTVAGRKFRRQGDAWVDANYSAGQSYTVVRRNSEQFRALVGDEPGLRRIAEALGGEVIVVWKGRAYRIR